MKYIKMDPRERKALKQAFLRFLPIPIILIILFSIVISFSYYDRKRHDIIHDQQDYIFDAMLDYRDYITDLTSIVRSIDTDYLELTAMDAPIADIEALFAENMLAYPTIDQLRILDINGVEILRLNQGSSTPYVVAPENLQDKSDRYFYQEARDLGRHQFLFSALDLNVENGEIDMDPVTGLAKPTLRITSPLDMGDYHIGYLVVNFLMRPYLDDLRKYQGEPGCYILMLNEDGYLYNDADDANNFGFCYEPGSEQYNRTIYNRFPNLDLSEETGSLVMESSIATYITFDNVYDRSKNYFLADAAARKIIFLIYYGINSPYKQDLHFSYVYHLVMSWKTQLLVWAGTMLLYVLMLQLIFMYDRTRFTNLFADNRYTKATLRLALNQHEFINYYQPIINIQDGSMLGIEALSRWQHEGQVLPPSMFIDEMLHYQLGQRLDENSFEIVRHDRKLMEKYPCFNDTFISINCCQQTFDSLIKEPPTTTIRLTEEEKTYIVLELLEDIVFNKDTQERMRELYKHNLIFAIDDFGTGNSMLPLSVALIT